MTAPALTSHPPAARRGALEELDELTLRRAQRGEAAACRALVEHHQAAVFALLGRMLGGGRGALVEDLAQETFLAVFRRLADFAPAGPARLSSWILTIASRRAIDELRRRGPGWATPISAEDVIAAEGDAGRDERAAGRGDAALERKRLAAAIEQALAELSPPYRAAFVLYELHGLEHAEIASALEIDAGTVKSRLSRARAALRAALVELHHER